MTTREDDLLERIRQRRKLSEDLDLDSLISARRKALEAGEEPEVETVTTAEEEGPGIIERISERVRRVLPGGGPEAPERDPGALGGAVSSTVERGQRLAEATGFPMPDAPRRVPRQRRHTAARDVTAEPPRRATGITEEPDQGPTREELLARSDVTDTGAREAGRRARRLRNPEIVPLPDDVEDAETPQDVAFGLERLLEDETREDLEELKRRGGRGRRRLGETVELRRPSEAGETRFRMAEGVQAQREELEELSRDLDLILPPGARTAARVARGLERSPLLGQGIIRPLRSLVQKHVRDGDMSAEEFLDTVEARGMDVPAEVLGELAGYGLEIGATARGLGAVGEALPSGSRTGRFLRAFNPSRPTTRARAAATGAAEGLPSDVAAAIQHDDPSMIPLGMGLGAAAGTALRPRLKGGRARGAEDLADDVGGAERRTRADEVETVSTRREERPGIRRRIADAIDPSRQEELEQAFRDPLTELPNQTAFRRARERLESDPNTELVEIDLTNFKAINDQVSREAGDARLKEVANVARQVADEAGVETRDVFRAGGDEFAIAVPRGQGDEIGRRIAERVEDFEVPGTDFTSRVRYGVGETFEEADAAAQAAKKGEAGARFRDTSAGPPRPDIEGRARDAVDEASATERVPIREEASPVVAEGQETVIKSADGTETRASYAIVDASEAPPSHNPVSFDRNPDFPEGIQERRYHADPVAQEEVVERARELDPSILLDPTQRPTDGPAIIRPDGVRLSGNQRGMLLMRAKELHPERFDDYVDELVQRAEEFGISPQQAEGSVRDILERGGTPELVRMTADSPTSRGELAELMSKFNDVATKAKDPLAEAATRARRLREAGGALRTFRENISEEETLRSFLGTASGREFVQDLVAEGVIPRQEASRFINRRTGAVNAEGKTLVERMMQSAAVGDPEVIDRAPPSWLRKIEKAIPAIIQSSQYERWDLGPVLREALDLGAAVRASSAARTVDDLVGQTDLTGRRFSPEATQLARFLENTNPNDVSAALRQYAEQASSAARARQSEDLFGFEPPTPRETRGDVFGTDRPAALDPDDAQREAFTDLFGEPVAREGPAQGSLLPEGGGPQGMSEAIEEARSVVSRLEGKVRRGAASDAEARRYNEARSLLRRGEGLDAEEVAARSREAEPTLQEDDTRDLFELRPDEPRLLRPREAQRSVPEDVDLTPFEGMSREEFLGSPKITSEANAADLRPKLTGSAAEVDPQPWHQGLQIRRPDSSRGYTKYVVTDDGKPVASYDGDTLVVDPEYRDQGIATQLVIDFRTRNPNVPPATTRTAAAQNIQETAWEAIQREVRRRRSGRPDDPRPLTPRDQRPQATETPPPEPSPLSEGFDPTGVRQARRRGQPGPQASAQLRDIGEFSMEPGSGVAPDPTKIARDLAEAVDVKLAEGQLTGRVRSALGIFKPRSEVVRVQDVSDIRTLGHEVGHSLQKVFFGSQGGRLNDAPLRELSEPIQQELRQLGSGVSDESLAEGWAEYWRRYVDNPSVLADRAPRLHQYVQRGLDEHPEIRTALQKTRDQWRLHREAGPEARIASKISDQDEPRHFDVSDAWDRFRTNVFDDFHPIKRVVDFLEEKGVGPTSITENAEQLARLVRGSTGQGDHFLERGTLDFATLETRGKPLKEIVEPVKGRLDRFKRYIVARRAVELHERGINPGFREEDVRAFVRRMDDVHGEDFQQAFAELQTYQTQLLEYLRDAGVISDESLDAILEVNRNYVPFYRALEGKEFLGGLSERFGHLFSPVKRIKGSGEKVIDPLESITKNTYLYTHLAAKQQVSQALGRLAMKEGAGQMLEGIMRPVEPIKFTLDEIRSQLDEMLGGEVVGEIVETMAERGGREDPLEELLMVFRPGDYFDRPNTISVLQGGKRQWFEVDEDLYAALEGLNREHLDWTARFLGAPSRTLRAGAVLAPEFQIRNPARDQMMAFVQSEYGYKPGIDMARGMFELLRKGDAYWQWKAAGGERAALLGLDRRAMRDKVEELIGSGGVPNVVKDPLDGLRALSAVMEDATRMGEFLRAREQLGTSKEALQQAAGAAREVSTDFARKGAKLAFVRHTTAFWNARMQGYDRLARAIQKNPRQAVGRAFASITLPSILEYQINRDNPEYWEIPQWQRDLFWLFEINDTWIRVPKPFELGVIFGTMPQRILQSFDQEAPNELTEFFLQTTTSETEGLAPFPTALQPLVENFANYSVFLERPIVPLSQERLSAERQFGPYTSEAAKMIGRWAPGQGLSPRKLDHLLFSYTGGLGRHAMSAVDRGVAAVRGDPPDPSGTLADVPGLRGVIARDPGFSSTSVEKFYRLYARANRAVADLRDLENRGSREDLREQAGDPKKRRLRALAPGLRDVAGELSDLRDERDRIRQDPNMDPDEKRERMEELGRRAMIMARRAIQRLPEEARR